MSKQILICQGRSCRKYGSKAVLTKFESESIDKIKIIASGCLGKCGSGANVLILPEKKWYLSVKLDQVSAILLAIKN
jgi:(2Fe-2S) ferredoxin